ncbi:MAG: DNA modification methylase [Brasilonema angustatum HA4187-MV1]|jgi:site-specific DNA-methyltransferase (adenine-specific)|nr:DNA modification methylase [Brasilonema angustatum HA4187-MV1]
MKEVKLTDLSFDPKNANKGSERGRGMLEESLQQLGAGRSIVVDRNGVVIAGNKTLETAVESGFLDGIEIETDGSKLVIVRRSDLDLATDVKAKQLAICDNRVSEVSLTWDAEILKEISKDVDLSAFFTSDELSDLFTEEEEPNGKGGTGDPDAVPGAKELRCKLGDIWELGEHKLIVGDSTDSVITRTLLGDEKIQLIWTDPPYNVDYDPEERNCNFSEERKTNPLGKIQNDKMSDEEFRAFLDKAYSRMNEVLEPGCPIYITHADTMGHHFRNAFVAQPWKLQSCLIWLKNHFALSRSDYHWQHEPILYGWKEGAAHRWYGDRTKTTILEYSPPHYDKKNCDTDGYIHPTQKPTSLIEFCIANSSKGGDLVLDPFGGSGSTLIACQNTNRRARLVELDPRFASAIIERYETYTGDVAHKIGEING